MNKIKLFILIILFILICFIINLMLLKTINAYAIMGLIFKSIIFL